jgi:hypothetical protein
VEKGEVWRIPSFLMGRSASHYFVAEGFHPLALGPGLGDLCVASFSRGVPVHAFDQLDGVPAAQVFEFGPDAAGLVDHRLDGVDEEGVRHRRPVLSVEKDGPALAHVRLQVLLQVG